MKVLICGIGRSGSTYVYNICRSIFDIKNEGNYDSYLYDYDVGIQEQKNKDVIIKSHPYLDTLKDWADIIITFKREYESCMKSFKRFKPRMEFDNILYLQNECYFGWREHSDLEISYEDDVINENKCVLVDKIKNILNCNYIDSEYILENYDKVILHGSLFRSNHIDEMHNTILTSK